MMQTPLKLALLIPLLFCCGCYQDSSQTISLGMAKADVIEALQQLDATDFSGGMQVYHYGPVQIDEDTGEAVMIVDYSPPTERMWSIESPDITLETEFENGKLVKLNVWDFRRRELNSYHHTIEYDEVSKLNVWNGPIKSGCSATVVKTHNRGVNSP